MADKYVRVTREEHSEDDVHDVGDNAPAMTNQAVTIARAIWFLAGLLLLLLAFRFILALLGANPANGFANFIYTVSHPFVEPFFTLFRYNLQYGVSRFEVFTLVAMAVYAAIAWALSSLVALASRPHMAV